MNHLALTRATWSARCGCSTKWGCVWAGRAVASASPKARCNRTRRPGCGAVRIGQGGDLPCQAAQVRGVVVGPLAHRPVPGPAVPFRLHPTSRVLFLHAAKARQGSQGLVRDRRIGCSASGKGGAHPNHLGHCGGT
jgi:hypothetical protein